jgi:pyridoxine 5-phosphate synthase
MSSLGVNIDHVASVRQIRRSGDEPDPVYAAVLCQSAGADAIVAHLREDRRHINDRDIFLLRQAVRVKFNMEMSLASDIVAVACKVRADQVTLVPEKRKEVTTEGGLDVCAQFARVRKAVEKLRSAGTEPSLFIDPLKRQIDAAVKCGVKAVELHTGSYANAASPVAARRRLRELKETAVYGAGKGLRIYAGHGLDYRNVKAVTAIRQIEEYNIGYSIICRAVITGIVRAVKDMKELIGD